MPGVVLLVAAVVTNYAQHRRHRPTICSTTRQHVPWPVVLVGWGVLTAWILPHIHRGYPSRT